jgi:hypothetical protein
MASENFMGMRHLSKIILEKIFYMFIYVLRVKILMDSSIKMNLSKTLLKLFLGFLLTTRVLVAAVQDELPEASTSVGISGEQRRVLDYKIQDDFEKRANSLMAALEDNAESLDQQALGKIGKVRDTIDSTLKTTKEVSKRLKTLSEKLRILREARWVSQYCDVSTKEDQSRVRVTSFLNQLLDFLNKRRLSDYDLRVCDFEEYYEQYDTYQKVLTEIHREEALFFADCLKSIHELLGDEVNPLFDQFSASKLNPREDKYVSIYFRILKGYAAGKVEQVPAFGLCYLSDLDQNPLDRKREALQLEIKGMKKDTAIARLQRGVKEKELQEMPGLIMAFDTEQRPILEKHYWKALENLEIIGDLSGDEVQTLQALRQKFSVGEASKKGKKKKKKPKSADHQTVSEPSSSESPLSIAPLDKSDDDEEALVEVKKAASIDQESAELHRLAEIEIAQVISQQQEQYARDREAKKTSPVIRRQNAEANAEPEEAMREQVIHGQNAKLIAEFREARAIPWSDFEKFMTTIMGGCMESNGGSHRKFKFTRDDDSEVSLFAYCPHKFGSNDVGSRQLESARKFLREILERVL